MTRHICRDVYKRQVFNRIDGAIYKIGGVDQKKGMNWKQYAVALLATNGVMLLIGYAILRLQALPVFNPNGIGAMEETLSFNTIISFMTNTNPVSYTHLDVYTRQE